MLRMDDLKGAIVYYDGQQNDARMNVTLAVTAADNGAGMWNCFLFLIFMAIPFTSITSSFYSLNAITLVVANYTEVVALTKDANGKICGAEVRDRETGEIIKVKAKGTLFSKY